MRCFPFISSLLLLLAISCSKGDQDIDNSVTFNSYSINCEVGDTYQLEAKTNKMKDKYDMDANPNKLEFTSADPSIATVSAKGLVTAVATGSTTINVSGKGLAALRSINVKVLAKSETLMVMSFNTKVDDRSGSQTGWAYRKTGALEMIRKNSPDLIGLQEGQPHQITFLSKNLPGYKWYGLGRGTGKVPATTDSYASEECMAIFYKTDVLKMEECGTFWLSETPESVTKGWDANCIRTCTWARFTVIRTGKPIYYFNTHLDHKGPIAREESIKLIIKKMAEINKTDAPMFLTADFNSATTNAIFNPLKAVMKDARVEAPITDSHKTFHNYESAEGKSVIDHVWFSGRGNEVLKYHTVSESYAGMQFVSDHYPVYGQFQVR